MKIFLLVLTVISIIVSLGMFIWLKKALDKAAGKDESVVKDIIRKFVIVDVVCLAVITISAMFLLKM